MLKDRLQLEFDNVKLQFKRTKIELALCDEKKSEQEQCYKNEIKYLIEKLLKSKNKLTKERLLATNSESNNNNNNNNGGYAYEEEDDHEAMRL